MRKNYGIKRRILAAVLALMCILTTGCSPLIYNMDMEKAVVKDLDFRKLDAINDISNQVSSYGNERYNIDGTDAFYILPNGVPEPESIIDFQVVDLVDDTTLVYAYQSLYALSDSTGRGGKTKTGVRPLKEGRAVGEPAPADADDKSPWELEDEADMDSSFAADTVDKMVTVYMAYNTQTGAYNVFGSFVNDIEVKVESSFGTKNTYVYMKPVKTGLFSMNQSGMTVEEINPLFTQKVNDGYFLYHWGAVYLYDLTGRVEYYQNLDEARSLMSGLGGTHEIYYFNGMMIENVFMDTRYHVYIQCSKPKENTQKESKAELNTDATAEQSEDEIEDEEPGVSQSMAGTESVLYEISMVNLGRMMDSDPNSDSGYRYFISENKNFDQESAAVLDLDGSTVSFDGEPDQADADRWLENEKNAILEAERPSYEVYHFYQDLFPYKLYYGYGEGVLYSVQKTGVPDTEPGADGKLKNDQTECYEIRPDTLNEKTVSLFKDSESGYYPFAYMEQSSSQRSLVILKRYFDSVQFDPQRLITEPVTIHVTAVWGDNGSESKEFDCTVDLPKEYHVSFYSKGGYADINSAMIQAKAVPSGDAGYLKLSTKTRSGGMYSIILPYLLSQLWPNISKYYSEDDLSRQVTTEQVIEGTSNGRETVTYPTIVGETARNILAVGTSGAGGKQKDKFVIQSDKTLMVLLDRGDVAMVNIPMLLFDTYGDIMNVDYSQPKHNENDITTSYLEQGLKLYEDDDGIWWLYAASPEKGILKVNLNNSKQFQTFLRFGESFLKENIAVQNKEMIEKNSARESTGQVSSYPYYCLWLDEDGNGCYALGFQDTDYSYDAKDLCGAKIYHVSFTDEKAAANLAYSSARKNPEFQKAYAAKDVESCRKWWISNIEALDLAKEPEMVTTLTNYFDFLEESLVSRDKGYSSFAQITAKSAGNRSVALNEEEVKQMLSACDTYQDVERLMAELRTDLSDNDNPFESAEDPFKRIDRDQEQIESAAEEIKPEDATMETVIPTGEAIRPSISDEDASRFSGDAAYYGQKEKIIEKLKDLNGFTSEEAWIEELQKIVDYMHPATTYSEYKSNQKKKEAALAAKNKAEQEKAAKDQEAKEAKLQEELEQEKQLRDRESAAAQESLRSAEEKADKAAESIGGRIEESSRAEESSREAESSKALESSRKAASSEAARESSIRASIDAERDSLDEESRKALEELERQFPTVEETLEVSSELQDETTDDSEGGPGYLEPEETLPQ